AAGDALAWREPRQGALRRIDVSGFGGGGLLGRRVDGACSILSGPTGVPPALSFFATGWVLSRHQADPRSETAARREHLPIPNFGYQSGTTIGPTPGISSSRRLSSLERCQAWIRFSILKSLP